MLIEINKKDLHLLDGLDISYIKIGSVQEKFEEEESLSLVKDSYELESEMDSFNVPSSYKDRITKEVADDLSYYLEQQRDDYINKDFMKEIMKEIIVEKCLEYRQYPL